MYERVLAESQIDEESAPLDLQDRRRLARVESSLAWGLALKEWWEQTTGELAGELDEDKLRKILQDKLHARAFRLLCQNYIWPEGISYGFFDRALIGGHKVPIIGRVQQMIIDRPKIKVRRNADERDGVRKNFREWHDNLHRLVQRSLRWLDKGDSRHFKRTVGEAHPDRGRCRLRQSDRGADLHLEVCTQLDLDDELPEWARKENIIE